MPSAHVPISRARTPVFRVIRAGGLDIQVPAQTGAIVQLSFNGTIIQRETSVANIAHFWDLAPGNYVAATMYGPGTGSAWSVVVGPSSYTVTRLVGGGVTGYIAVG